MNNYFLSLLLGISSLLGVNHPQIDSDWIVTSNWSENDGISRFSATNSSITQKCSTGSTITFPMIIHGAHVISVDGIVVAKFGDPTFKNASPFYLKPSIECSAIEGNELQWTAYSYSQYFARFATYPQITKKKTARTVLLHEIVNIISGAGLLLLCFITSIIFFRKIENDVFIANILANLGFAMYFLFSCSNYFGLEITMLNAHKFADLGVWLGISSFFYILHHLKLSSRISFISILSISIIASLIIATADDGDTIQFGTSLPFPLLILILIEATVHNFLNLKRSFLANISRTLSVLFFFCAGLYEIAIVVGFVNSSPLLAIGILGALVAITLIVQSGITATYRQRDDLLNELENKVEERTMELKTALKEKETAQAELIQNAKLASLGTLSAGIAHEINNNINYVNACLVGLEKELKKLEVVDRTKMDKLLHAIKHGTKMTIDIVNSLRNYTGLNQAKTKDVEFKEIVDSVKNIIRRKTENVVFKEHYSTDTLFHCNVVGMNQVVMNLLTNAIDAMDKDEKVITISATKTANRIEITFSDNGSGIPDHIKDKIFDPFFTTKDVGSGTGLGLHIVKKEIDNHRGTIRVDSSPKGTTFSIVLPVEQQMQEVA